MLAYVEPLVDGDAVVLPVPDAKPLGVPADEPVEVPLMEDEPEGIVPAVLFSATLLPEDGDAVEAAVLPYEAELLLADDELEVPEGDEAL